MNFIAAVQALVDGGADFVIIGGWSAILHGSSSVTNDLDICYSRNPDNLKRVVASLTPFHPRLRDLPRELPFVWDQATLRNAAILTLSTDLGAIDLLAEVNGLGGFEEVKAQLGIGAGIRSRSLDARPASADPGKARGWTGQGFASSA